MSTTNSEAPVAAAANALNTKFNRLFRDGKLLQIHVSKWCMATSLSETDLPLAEGKSVPSFVKLGAKMLIDEKEHKKFTSLENRARTYLRVHAHPFPIAQANFVPNKILLSVLTKLDEFKTEYYALVNAFIANYEAHKEATLQKYPDHRALLEPYYPHVDIVRGKFSFHVGMFEVAFPKQMKEINLASVQAEASERQAMEQRFQREWQAQYQHSMSQVDGFMKEAITSTRGRIVEVFETIANKIQKREVVSTVNLKTMGNIIEAFDGLDFLDDQAVRAKLATVRNVLTTNRDFKTDQEAIATLGNAVNEVLAVARETTDIDALTGEYVRRIDV